MILRVYKVLYYIENDVDGVRDYKNIELAIREDVSVNDFYFRTRLRQEFANKYDWNYNMLVVTSYKYLRTKEG